MTDQEPPPIPDGYQPGQYIPFKDRDPSNPTSIAGQWHDPARQAQMTGQVAGRPLTQQERYRAIYGVDAPFRVDYASWGRRVLGYLVDALVGTVAAIPLLVGYWMIYGDLDFRTDINGNRVVDENTTDISSTSIAMLVLGLVIVVAFNLYNVVFRQGSSGYTFGKTAVGIRLVSASDGQPVGALICFLRQLAHYVDSLVCYLGWLWPLWDAKRQTLGDKIVGTVVIIQPADEVAP